MAAWPLGLGELAFREFRRFCVLTPPVLVLIPLASRTVPLSLSMAAPENFRRDLFQRRGASLRRLLVKCGLNAGRCEARQIGGFFPQNYARNCAELLSQNGTFDACSPNVPLRLFDAPILNRIERVRTRDVDLNNSASDTNPCRGLPAWCRAASTADRDRARRAGPVRDRRLRRPSRPRNAGSCRHGA